MGRVFIFLTLLIPTFSLLISPESVTLLLQRHTERSATRHLAMNLHLRFIA